MPVKYIPYYPNTVTGQAILDNITRTRRVLRYRDNGKVVDRIKWECHIMNWKRLRK